SHSGGCSIANGVITCNLGSMAAGATATVTIVVRPTMEGTITNTSNVRSSAGEPSALLADNTVTNINNVMPLVDLALTASDFPDPVTLNSNLVYTLVITNRGISVAPGVTLTDTLPGGVNFLAAIPNQGSCSLTGNVVTCSLGNIGG